MMLWLCLTAAAGIQVGPLPAVGEQLEIVVTDRNGFSKPGIAVRVESRPSAPRGTEANVGLTDSSGRVLWTPDQPGPVIVRAGDEELRLQVPYREAPVDLLTTLALLLAGALALVGYGLTPFIRRR